MSVNNFFCKKLILVILVVQIICGFSLFAMSKAPDSIEGCVKVYGNEPHTYLGLETQEGKVFLLKAEKEILSELQNQQGLLLELRGKIEETKKTLVLKHDYFEVIEWSRISE